MGTVSIDGAEIVNAANDSLTTLVRSLDEQAWNRPAAAVGWTCRATMEHIGGVFAHYAGQVVSNPADHYQPFTDTTSPSGSAPLGYRTKP